MLNTISCWNSLNSARFFHTELFLFISFIHFVFLLPNDRLNTSSKREKERVPHQVTGILCYKFINWDNKQRSKETLRKANERGASSASIIQRYGVTTAECRNRHDWHENRCRRDKNTNITTAVTQFAHHRIIVFRSARLLRWIDNNKC